MLVAAILFRAWLRRRPSDVELERQRRVALNRMGKIADGSVLDVLDCAIEYSYDVRGVGYTATQDISTLQDRMPGDRFSAAGPASVKYDPRNPANSIVLCEDWSGLRTASGMRSES